MPKADVELPKGGVKVVQVVAPGECVRRLVAVEALEVVGVVVEVPRRGLNQRLDFFWGELVKIESSTDLRSHHQSLAGGPVGVCADEVPFQPDFAADCADTVTTTDDTSRELRELVAILDAHSGRYRELAGVTTFGAYVGKAPSRADEELLTEPILAQLLERVLGFPVDAYFPQLGKSGQKPDFTPIDLVAHPFVLDAKSSDQRDLHQHEKQIRGYVDQRGLDHGILFNLREVRVFRRGASGSDPSLSFSLLPLWEYAHGRQLTTPEVATFVRFCGRFGFRQLSLDDRVSTIRSQRPWAMRPGPGTLEVDVDYLVERLRRLAERLTDDASIQVDGLEQAVALDPGRERRVVGELKLLTLDLAPGTDIDDLPDSIAEWREGAELVGRAWRQYLLRVAYLAVTRVLLYRAWEEAGFVRQVLFDGGFGTVYDEMQGNLQSVLQAALSRGGERYPWLFGSGNNYDWYRPSAAVLVDLLYALVPVPLGRLDADVLGGLYEAYVDEIDRDRLGQFYTPRAVVRFMLDEAGLTAESGLYRVEGDRRHPLRIFDFATGSGGFLVEAARRIVDDPAIGKDDVRALNEGLAAIVTGIYGGEISPFPYYLTEVNLLLQVSRLLGRLSLAGKPPPPFVLGALHIDSLSARSAPDRSLHGLKASDRADHGELVQDDRFDLVPLDGRKLDAFRELREDGTFDLVVGNPPYVAEANNKPLFDRLRSLSAWKGTYRGKTDYLYYFLLLALEKLRPGGRLCVITPAGWMNAGEADFVRGRLASELTIEHLYLFGSTRLFAPETRLKAKHRHAPTPTVESLIIVARKEPPASDHRVRIVLVESEEAVAKAISGDLEARTPDRDQLLAELHVRSRGKPSRKNGIRVFDVSQSQLTADEPWPVKHASHDVATRVVRHLSRAIERDESPVERLDVEWDVFQGIQTGADAFTPRVRKRLGIAELQRLEAEGRRLGEPIMELPPGTELSYPWKANPEFLAKAPESRGILYGAVDDEDYTNLVWIGRTDTVPPLILATLEPWRDVLSNRAEFVRNARRRWFETAWSRDKSAMAAPKVIALYRTDRGRFAVDEEGSYRPSIKATLVVGRDAEARAAAPVAYLCGLLNSELLDLWYGVRGKTPRDVWRNYEPKRMNEMPYRRPEGDPRVEEVADGVRRLAANRRALLPYRLRVRDLGRIVKDPWRTGRVDVLRAAMVADLPPADTVSVRLDPTLTTDGDSGASGRIRRGSADRLTVSRGRVVLATVSGAPDRLDLLELVAASGEGGIGAALLPKDPASFEDRCAQVVSEVTGLLIEGRRLVEEVERQVCTLYGVSPDLTERVVQHASRRAGGIRSSEPAGIDPRE